MRRNRLIWAFLWILSLVGISFYGGAVSYGFFFLMTFIPIASLLYLLYVYFCFHIYQEIGSRTLVVNQPVSYYFRLVNEYFLSFVGVRVRFYTTFSNINNLSDQTEYELLPKTEIKRETTVVCKYRGSYEIGIKKVEIQDYFRLFRVSYHNPETRSVIVKPELIYLDDLTNIDANVIMKDARQNLSELDILTRKYVPGDDIRQIHWSLSGKNHELMTRTKIGEDRQGITFLMDTRRCSNKLEEFLPAENKMLELLLALSYYFAEKGIPILECHMGKELVDYHLDRMQQFEAYYDYVSAVSFLENNSSKLFWEDMSVRQSIFDSQAVFMLLQEWTLEAKIFAQTLTENHVTVLAYIISDEEEREEAFLSSSKMKTMRIPSNAKLKEVL